MGTKVIASGVTQIKILTSFHCYSFFVCFLMYYFTLSRVTNECHLAERIMSLSYDIV